MKGTVFPLAIFVSMAVLILPAAMIAPQQEIRISLSSGCGGGLRRADVTEEIEHRHRILGTMPRYPAAAIAANISGTVVLEAVINIQGHITDLEVIKGNRTLAQAAKRAVKEWKYQPVVVDGHPIEALNDVVLVFRLGPKPRVIEAPKAYSAPKVACSSIEDFRLIRKVDPEYPAAATIAHVQGEVVIEILIDKDGDVAEAKAMSGHPLLVGTALNAIKQWKYKPSAPIAVRSRVTIQFHM